MMKEEKIEKAARKPVEIQKETGIELRMRHLPLLPEVKDGGNGEMRL